MIDLMTTVNSLVEKYEIDDPDIRFEFTKLLVGRNWFGMKPIVEGDRIKIEEADWEKHLDEVNAFMAMYSQDSKLRKTHIFEKLKRTYPKTADLLQKYIDKSGIDDGIASTIAAFLGYYLVDELPQCIDAEIRDLLNYAFDDLQKKYSDVLADFINVTAEKHKTGYRNRYFMSNYSERTDTAYTPEEYMKMLYRLFNEKYIEKNKMYDRACRSKNYIDTWLFLSLHFVCAVRNTDLTAIPRPRLTRSPQDTLMLIKNDKFSDEMARAVLFSIVWNYEVFQPAPNKTKRFRNTPSLKMLIPTSAEVHMGKLFAIAEAHYQMVGEEDKPFIRAISEYKQITRYMGEEIGELFLEADFKTRSANKSFMQIIRDMTSDVIGSDEFNINGDILAALARSHKGSYGEFAKATQIYLKDAKMSGFSPEFVSKEMFERGVLSCVPSMLLKMITDGSYNDLKFIDQTKVLKALKMTPREVETTVKIAKVSIDNSVEIAKQIYRNYDKEGVLSILHQIANCKSPSKDGHLECIMPALMMDCPYPDRSSCISCEYSVTLKSTMGVLLNEVKRLKHESRNTQSVAIRNRDEALAMQVIIPAIDEIICNARALYGDDMANSLVDTIKEANNAKQ